MNLENLILSQQETWNVESNSSFSMRSTGNMNIRAGQTDTFVDVPARIKATSTTGITLEGNPTGIGVPAVTTGFQIRGTTLYLN